MFSDLLRRTFASGYYVTVRDTYFNNAIFVDKAPHLNNKYSPTRVDRFEVIQIYPSNYEQYYSVRVISRKEDSKPYVISYVLREDVNKLVKAKILFPGKNVGAAKKFIEAKDAEVFANAGKFSEKENSINLSMSGPWVIDSKNKFSEYFTEINEDKFEDETLIVVKGVEDEETITTVGLNTYFGGEGGKALNLESLDDLVRYIKTNSTFTEELISLAGKMNENYLNIIIPVILSDREYDLRKDIVEEGPIKRWYEKNKEICDWLLDEWGDRNLNAPVIY